jgi:histidinol-phosphate aminotransferase
MTPVLPPYIAAITPYKPGKPLAELEREYGLTGSIKLASNENPLGPCPKAVEAVRAQLGGLHRYPEGSGYGLTRKLADKLGVPADHIVLGNGSDDLIGMLARALLQPGDAAIMPQPSFLMYEIMVRSTGADPAFVPLKPTLEIDLEAICRQVTDNTRLIFLCNPNNPTGRAFSAADLARFLHDLPAGPVVVIDEAYHEFARDPQCASGLDALGGAVEVVTLRTFSKAYGLAGLRVGYGVMSAELADILHRIRQPFNVSTLAQVGAAAALEDTHFLEKTVDLVHSGIDYLFNALAELGITCFPTEANFFMLDVKTDADAVFEAMLRQGVIVRSMASYGYPGYIRINAGLPEENRRFVQALKKVLDLD